MDEVQVTDVQEAPVVDVAPEIQSSETPVEAAPVETPPVQEKMLAQSQVNKIVAREARQAAEKARNDAFAEIQRQQVSEQIPQEPAGNMGGIPQMSQAQIEQYILGAAQKMSTQMQANQMAQDFESKIKAEIESDPDFGDLYDEMNITQHPELVIWMSGMDNSAKVMKELAQNPSKFANVLMLAKSGIPGMAKRELTKISDSIKTNQAALAKPSVKEPLDQLSPSSVGIDNGQMSVSDYMKQPWLRG